MSMHVAMAPRHHSATDTAVANVVRHELISEAEGLVRAAEAACNNARAALDAAEGAIEDARHAPERLFRHAVSGAPVGDQDLDAIFCIEERLKHRRDFRRRLLEVRTGELVTARGNLAHARNVAHVQSLRAAAEARIAAAELATAAAGTPSSRGDAARMQAAQSAWDTANEQLRSVQSGCTLLRGFEISPRVSASPERERQVWASFIRRIEGLPAAA